MDSQVECPINIAGFALNIRCEKPSLAGRLLDRYAAFLSQEVTATEQFYTIQVHSPEKPSDWPAVNKEPTFKEGRLVFPPPGMSGEIDPAAGKAQLSLASSRQVHEVDYFLRAVIAMLAFQSGGLLFHSAGIVRNGRAFLFFGPSNSGKTTVSRLSADDQILNDDLVLLLPEPSGIFVHSTPFWNPSQLLSVQRNSSPSKAPLGAMLRLVKDRRVFLEAMTRAQALAELVSSVPIISADPSRSSALMGLCDHIARQVPVYHLHFLQDTSFWPLVENILPVQPQRFS